MADLADDVEGDGGGAEKGAREDKVEADVGAGVNAFAVNAEGDEFGNVPYYSGHYLVGVSSCAMLLPSSWYDMGPED